MLVLHLLNFWVEGIFYNILLMMSHHPYYCIRVLHRNRTIRLYMELNIELTHLVIEAKKFCSLLSISCKTKKTSGINQYLPKSLRAMGDDGGTPSLSPKAWASGAPMSQKQKKMDDLTSGERDFALLSPSVLFRPPTDWMLPALIGVGSTLYSVYPVKCWTSSRSTFKDTPRNNYFTSYLGIP